MSHHFESLSPSLSMGVKMTHLTHLRFFYKDYVGGTCASLAA